MHFSDLITTLKHRREDLNITQEMLAEIAGVAIRTLKSIESGRGNPTYSTLQKLGDVLGLELCLCLKKIPGEK